MGAILGGVSLVAIVNLVINLLRFRRYKRIRGQITEEGVAKDLAEHAQTIQNRARRFDDINPDVSERNEFGGLIGTGDKDKEQKLAKPPKRRRGGRA